MENKKSENSSTDDFFLPTHVKKGFNLAIRQRIDTLLLERGKKWADIYNELGWSKSHASIVHNGRLIPPHWQRVALAEKFGVDTSVIWTAEEIFESLREKNSDSGEGME